MFTRSNRKLEIITPLGHDVFVPVELHGIESLSAPFQFDVDVFSEYSNIDAHQLLGKSASVLLCHYQTNPVRIINGIITCFTARKIDVSGMRRYQIRIEPWYSSLRLSSDCKRFQQLSVPEIAASIFKTKGFADYDCSGLRQKYLKREYCTQYNETHFDFIHRILAEAGIFYYFIHTEKSHRMILADQSIALPTMEAGLPYVQGKHDGPHIQQWLASHSFFTNQVLQRDYNYHMPSHTLETSSKQLTTPKQLMGNRQFEQFYYPGRYRSIEQGEAMTHRCLQALEWQHHLVTGQSDQVQMKSGEFFQLATHPDPSQVGEYLPLQVEHHMTDYSGLSGHLGNELQHYHNQYVAIAKHHTFVPSRYYSPTAAHLSMAKMNPPNPQVFGTQSAVVVGSAGQSIHTDAQSRIKVQFKWDRNGEYDENSSCWIRTRQMAGGTGFGAQHIPRVGDEVQVGFLQGDPDRPIVLGALYHPEHREPYTLPHHRHLTAMTTHIIGADDRRGHRMIWDDTPGAERFALHAENDCNVVVKHNYLHQVGGHYKTHVNGIHMIYVEKGMGTIAAKSALFQAGGSVLQLSAGIQASPTSSGGKVALQVSGITASKPIAHVASHHHCPKKITDGPHTGGPITTGATWMKVNNLPIARVGDRAHCRFSHDVIAQGIANVSINGKPVAVLGSQTQHGGTISSGSPNVVVAPFAGVAIAPPALDVFEKSLKTFR